ncbi:MAG: DUF4268 domain-containing protein [Alphaproteobacteria bacterium]|nr:DUF4268 domain-containing protein [Alphaproteobacteria bacterium]
MTKIELSKLKEISDLRSVWPHEAQDFTPWLFKEGNIECLAEAIDLDITVEETESKVGKFSADIFAKETGTDRRIIIENQLKDTNHDHLGKIITYAAGKNASYIVWIVKHAQEEHKAAIEWLNENTNDDIGFFLCEIKLYQIDNSRIAPMFVTVSTPNGWKKGQKRLESEELSESKRSHEAFWNDFCDYAWKNQRFAKTFHKRKAQPNHWYSLSIGTSKAHINLVRFSRANSVTVDFWIPNDKQTFDRLYAHKNEIEEETEIKFNWCRMDDKKGSSVRVKDNFTFQKGTDLSEGFDWLMNVSMKIKTIFLKYM